MPSSRTLSGSPGGLWFTPCSQQGCPHSQTEHSTAALPQHPRATRPGLVSEPTLLLSSPAEAWISRYQKQLVRSISPQFLEEIICHLRRLDLLTAEEAGRAQEASSLPEQVRAVVDVLAGKGSYASQCLQTFIETTNSQLYLHITVYGRQRTGGAGQGALRPRGSAAAGSGPPPASVEEGQQQGGDRARESRSREQEPRGVQQRCRTCARRAVAPRELTRSDRTTWGRILHRHPAAAMRGWGRASGGPRNLRDASAAWEEAESERTTSVVLDCSPQARTRAEASPLLPRQRQQPQTPAPSSPPAPVLSCTSI